MGSSSEDAEGALELMPLLRATGDRVLTGITGHTLLQHCPLGFSVYKQTLAEETAQAAAEACRRLKAARPKASEGEKYSAGQTYWIGLGDKPCDILEQLAKEIFAKHTEELDFESSSVQKELCGAEYWAVVCQKGDDVAPHFDKCYCLEESHKINLHPLIGTVTYLSSVGAPTVITGVSEQYIPCFRPAEGWRRAGLNGKVPFVVSYPEVGKHVTFDGQLLHFADAGLALDGQAEASDRVALLVNVWVNHRPGDAESRGGGAKGKAAEAEEAPGQPPPPLLRFGTRGEIKDAGPLRPARRRTVRGGGLRFSGLFASPDRATEAGASYWYDRHFCQGPEAEGSEGPPPPKRRKRRAAPRSRLRAARAAERELLELVEAGLAVDSPGAFLTTAFPDRDEGRPVGLT